MGKHMKQLRCREKIQKHDNGIGKKLHFFASSALQLIIKLSIQIPSSA